MIENTDHHFYMGIDLEAYYDASLFDCVLTVKDKEKLPDYTLLTLNFYWMFYQSIIIKLPFFVLGLLL